MFLHHNETVSRNASDGPSPLAASPREASPTARPLGNTLADARQILGQDDAVVLVLGDSTGNDSFEWVERWANAWADSRAVTYHLWDDTSMAWLPARQLSSDGPALTIWNMSAPGRPSIHAADIADKQEQPPDLVIYNFGHNDTAGSIYTGLHEARYVTEQKWNRDSMAGVVMLQNPSLNSFRQRQAATMRSLREAGAPELGLPVVDVWAAFPDNPRELRGYLLDDVHPNADGGRLWAEVVRDALGP